MAGREDKKVVEFNRHHYYLPPELWPEILIRLPVKALVKFRCVSKSWRSLIESPDFALMQMTHNPENAKDHIFTVDIPHPYEEIKAKIRNSNSFAEIDEVGFDFYEEFEVDGCVNGVVCLNFYDIRGLFEIGLSNPSVKKQLRVPLPNMCKSGEDGEPKVIVDVSIGYDNVRNYIKLLAIGYPEEEVGEYGLNFVHVPRLVEVYGVSDRSWRTINVCYIEEAPSSPSYPWTPSKKVFVNGAVHWVVYDNDTGLLYSRAVAFDMGKEVFSYFTLPEIGEGGSFVTRVLVVFEELLGVMEMFHTYFNLWVMKQYGIQESWAKLYKVELSLNISEFVYLKKDGEVLYVKSGPEDKLMSCNVRKPEPRCVAKKVVFGRPYFTDTYVESLFLLG